MSPGPSRRGFLHGLGAGALITGFDTVGRNWVAGQPVHSPAVSLTVPVAPLKGRLLFSNAALSAAADDFGHIVHRRPWAVLQPGDIDDIAVIAVMLRFAISTGFRRLPGGRATRPSDRPRSRRAGHRDGHAGHYQRRRGHGHRGGRCALELAAERDAVEPADTTGADRLPGTVGRRHAVGRRRRRRVTPLRGAGRQRA